MEEDEVCRLGLSAQDFACVRFPRDAARPRPS
jgi:hypothetical protein